MTYERELEFFKTCTDRMCKTFAAKRNDYGASTADTYKRYGAVSLLVRMRDKLNRLDSLLVNNSNVHVLDESVEDTLFDLANYAIIAILEIAKHELEEKDELNCEGYRMD